MTSSPITLYFLSLTLSVLCAADVRIFGIQKGVDPFKLTILCPNILFGTTCLFNLPGLRKRFQKIKVRSRSHEESGVIEFYLEWDSVVLEAYVNAVREHGIFSSVRADGFRSIYFDKYRGNPIDAGVGRGAAITW
ncbi:hypothetical protein FOL47_007971 [Perkinsus chesapeaki]|uniref:Uncharacterized protein n=1 Tax=Perkinsus chesapeaki TaxID=330153 RepID=A0A7J6LGP6_PERCH|nr:hypothetical protein FOL47_007971 [Perkinsus chesapeaki]